VEPAPRPTIPAMTTQLEFDLSEVGAADLVTVRGELELASAFALATRFSEVVEERTGSLIVDLSDLSFMDSTGLNVLLTAFRRLRKRGRAMAVVCPPGPVRRVFELTRMLETLSVCDDRDRAMAAAVVS
jgi:anti-sigma B factor antagonist